MMPSLLCPGPPPLKMPEKYAHVDLDDLTDAMEKFDRNRYIDRESGEKADEPSDESDFLR